jgi:hypothetical protein
MAITATPYGQFISGLGKGTFNFTVDRVWVALFKSSYVPSLDFDSAYFSLRGDDDSDNEVPDQSGNPGDYIKYGQQLASTFWGYNFPTPHAAVLQASNVTWSNLNGTFRYAVLYKFLDDPNTDSSPLIGLLDYGTDQVFTGQPLTIDFSSGAIVIAA